MDFLVSILILILTAIVCLPLVKKYKEKKRVKRGIAECIDVLPGDKRYPIIGTTLRILKTDREDYWKLIDSRHRQYGPIFRSWLGSMPVVHIYKPEHAQVIFKSKTNRNKGAFYKYLLPWLGNGLISGNDPGWTKHRKVLTPAFHFNILNTYGEVFAEKGEYFANYLEQFSGKGYFEITNYLNRLTTDIIGETALGVQLNFLTDTHNKYAESIVGFCKGVYRRVYNPLLQNDFIFGLTSIGKESNASLKYIKEFNKRVIEERKEYHRNNKVNLEQEDEFGTKAKLSFLDLLIAQEDKNNFDYREIEEEVNTFMFAGQDTTAATVSYTLMALGNHPDIQKKVQEELDTLFHDDMKRKITPQDVASMEYMDRVVKEVLRCYNFVPHLGRELKEDIEIDGYRIPKGVNVVVALNDLHHDPDHYPDPYKFDPDRFLPEVRRHPFAFVPFSAGPRNCLGQKFGMQNSKTLLSYILRKYSVKCLEKPEDLKYYLEIVLRPQNGIHIALEKRHS